MKIPVKLLKIELRHLQQLKLSQHLYSTLDKLDSQLSQSGGSINISTLLIQLILLSDETPAHLIADLMISLSQDNIDLLEKETLSQASLFLKDYLKRDFILGNLKRAIPINTHSIKEK